MSFLSYGVYANMEVVLLVTLRIIAFLASAPFFSGQYVNSYIKVGLSFILANVVVSTGIIKGVEYTNGFFGYAVIGIKELAIGLLLGYVSTIIFNVVVMLGEMVDFQIGFTMASVYDPLSGIQMPISGNLYFFTLIAVMLITNMHHVLIKAIIFSYQTVGIGMFNMTQAVFDIHMEILSDMFITAMKLASPIIGIMLLINVALGVLGRAAPHLSNMFAAGVPMKIYISLYILVLITPIMIMSFSYIFDKVNINIIRILKGMSP